MFLKKLQHSSLPYHENLNLVSVIYDIRAKYHLDAHIQPQRNQNGTFTMPASEIVEAIKGSDLVALVADYGEEISISATPAIVKIAQEEGCIIELYIIMPFLFQGEQKGKRAVEKANELLQLKVDDLKCYNLDIIGATWTKVEPAKKLEAAQLATEKVTAMIMEDLSQRVITTMKKTSQKSQASDIQRLTQELE